jgi:hypothetical protein
MKDNIAFLEKTLARLLEWVRAADAKIPPVLAITMSMLGVIAALVPKATGWSILSTVVCALAVLPLLICLIALVLASFPRISGPKGSLLFFEGIKAHDPEAYLRDVKQASEESLGLDLAKQCHRNAEIVSAKYAYLRTAIASLFISLLPWLATVFILYRNR